MSKGILISSKKIILSFCFISFGIFLFIFSPNSSNNLWKNLMNLFMDRWFIIMEFLATSFLISEFYDITNNSNMILRSKSLKTYIKNNVIKILKLVLANLSSAVIIFIVGSFIIILPDFSNLYHELYSIPIWIYFVFLFIRTFILLSLVSIFLYFIEWKLGKIGTILFNLLMVFLLFVTVDIANFKSINSLSKMPILFTSYFKPLKFSNFLLEISSSIIQISIFSVIIMIMFRLFFIKNQENKIK